MKKRFMRFLHEQQTFFFAFAVFLILGLILQLVFNQEEIFLFINHHHSNFFDLFFVLYTWLGDGLVVVLISVLLCLHKLRSTILSLITYLYTSVIVQFLKFQFHLPRPLKYFEGKEHIRLIDGVDVHLYKSFPSGHSVSALALAVILAYISPNKKLGWIIFTIYVTAAFSRVYLAEHFFIDIYVGAVLGVILAIQVIFWLDGQKWYKSTHLDSVLNKRILKRPKKKSELDITFIEKTLFEKH